MNKDHEESPAVLMITELKEHLKRRVRIDAGREWVILCDDVDVIPYRDVFEAYLSLCGVKRWTWQDASGAVTERQQPGRILHHLVIDLISWGPMAAWQQIKVNRSRKQARPRLPGNNLDPILFLRSDHWINLKSGGSVGHLRGVIEGLRELGHPTIVFSTDALVDVPCDDHFFIVKPNQVWGRNLPEMPQVLYTERLFRVISQRWQEWNPTLIYQRYSMGNYTGALLKEKFKVPYVCEYNGSFTWMAENWDSRRLIHHTLIHAIEMLNLESADVVVVVSEALKRDLVQRGIDRRKILVNPNGVDPQRYSVDVDGSSIRRRCGFTDQVVIGFIGTFGHWHGAEKLAEAFGLLIRHHPMLSEKVRLLMIGDGVTLPKVQQTLEKYHVQEYSYSTGMIPQAEGSAYLAACDILVAPQIPNPDGTPFFGSPTKLFEYMASGKGIVASRLEQMAEVLDDGRTALLVTPGDAFELMLGIQRLVEDEDLRIRLGAAARIEVVEKYIWLAHTRRIVAFIEMMKGA